MKGFVLSAAAGLAALFGLSAAASVTGAALTVNAAAMTVSVLLGLPGVVTLLAVGGIL